MHKKGMVVMIAVGAGKPAPHGKSPKDKDMIILPIEALASDNESGESIAPEAGDSVILDDVEGVVSSVGEDGGIHIELKSAGGHPIAYADAAIEEQGVEDEVLEESAMDAMGQELLAAAVKEDEEAGR